MQTATKIPDFQPIFNILLPKCVCRRGFASDPTWGRPAPPPGKRWVSPLQGAPQNCGPQGPETPRSATGCGWCNIILYGTTCIHNYEQYIICYNLCVFTLPCMMQPLCVMLYVMLFNMRHVRSCNVICTYIGPTI